MAPKSKRKPHSLVIPHNSLGAPNHSPHPHPANHLIILPPIHSFLAHSSTSYPLRPPIPLSPQLLRVRHSRQRRRRRFPWTPNHDACQLLPIPTADGNP